MSGYNDVYRMYWSYMDKNKDGFITKAEIIAFNEGALQLNA
jgi:hypothetical protein